MARISMLLVAAIAALALAAAAEAKEVSAAKVCGASGCVTTDDDDQLRGIPLGGDAPVEPPPTSEFYWIDVTVSDGRQDHHFGFYYVPAARRIGGNGEYPGSLAWFPVYDSPVLDELVKGIEPFAALERWPTAVKSPGELPVAAQATDDGRSWLPWVIVAAAIGAIAVVISFVLAIRRRGTAAGAREATTA
ncbi:MAG: hypothetical protein M3322_12780 [Actinomycetota bacterium]|nr:hypothetical protein [Actinomycetota bacterium]